MPIEIHNSWGSLMEIYTLDTGTESDPTYDGEYIAIASGETYTFEPSGDYGTISMYENGETTFSVLLSSDWGKYEPP